MAQGTTLLENLINPQVMANIIDSKLTDDMKFAPLCIIDNTLVGRPGNTITLPFYKYIGAASVVAENGTIAVNQLEQDSTTATVAKVANGVEITDEAVLSGYGDPIEEASRQLRLSIADTLDNQVLAALEGIAAGMTANYPAAGITVDSIADALTLFGEDMDGRKVLLISPAQYAVLRKADDWLPASDIAAETLIRGTVGMVHGCEVVVTNRLNNKDEAFIVKEDALRLFLKRDTLVEFDRDILKKTTVITADKHFVAYLYNAGRAIKLVKGA